MKYTAEFFYDGQSIDTVVSEKKNFEADDDIQAIGKCLNLLKKFKKIRSKSRKEPCNYPLGWFRGLIKDNDKSLLIGKIAIW